MPQTVNQMSDYFGMDSAVAESGVVQSFRRQESGRAKPARIRACYVCGDPDHLCSACPFRRNCHRCLQPGHVARACLAPRPVRSCQWYLACPFLELMSVSFRQKSFSGTLCLLGATWPASQ